MAGSAPTGSAPGRVIAGRYQVGELLGRGGMAEVFAGTDGRLGRQVAIKLLLAEMAARPDIRTRFEAEARAAASLSHPNAVAVFDTGEHDGVPFIVMERLPGETLADRFAAGPVDVGWLRSVALEVLGALGAAHAAGIVHRDVKPGNILLAADGRAKVADFGIAKSAEAGSGGDVTATGQLLGTPAYLAPERVDGAPATPRSDLWALGVVLYEGLAGTRPFSGDTPLALARAVAAGQHRPLSDVRPDLDPGLVEVVERAMASDPGARFASAGQMSAALAGAGAAGVMATTVADTVGDRPPGGTAVLGDADRPPPPVSPTRTVGFRRRPDVVRRLAVGGAIAALVLLVVLLVARIGSGGRSGRGAAAPTTAAPSPSAPASTATTTSPAASLAQRIRDAAAGLGPDGGPLASILARRLDDLAGEVQAGDGGGEATALLVTVVAAERSGQISSATASSLTDLLAQVPGVNASVAGALAGVSTTEAPAPAPGGANKGKGKGKGKGD